ncbi:MAG: SMP-30/gluconolactonase/LRE family protein [Chitinophagaceae bacterium]|nr:SMP-30/gluconolactonase/LRE family protein [Chitinophagaceae bacterium]
MRYIFFLLIFSAMTGCSSKQQYKTTGSIERIDPALDSIISPDAKAEIIAEGFEWSEGPLWIGKDKMLLFSDVPTNTIYKWTEEKGKEVYLKPSGYTGPVPSTCKEPGSNGLLLNANGDLVLCQHGDRRMARMDAPLNEPTPKFITLADKYSGKRFSSPNDAVYSAEGELYFTDPPYGLQTQDDSDLKKETSFNGVYKIKKDGKVVLLVGSITRPNGIAFFPGGKRLLVANSDPGKKNWYVFDVLGDSLINGKEFYNLANSDKTWKGLPDGLKIDKNGNVFATGPGGILIFNNQGKLLGRLMLDNATSNCALSPDEKTLYITNDMYVLRIKMRN